ncbi:MAG: endonuclease/exonuclease/phosphatase family protein [Promethearchaeota archaeon]
MNKKAKFIFITLLITPLIIATISYFYSEIPIEKPKKDKEITFMTYNIHFGSGVDDDLNLERIAQNILNEEAEIIGLQEVDNGRITTGGVDIGFWLANRLNMYYYVYYPTVENEHTRGCGVLSKFPIKSAHGYDIPSDSMQRVMIHTVIKIDENLDIDVFVVHVGLSEEDTETQIEFILETIDDEAKSSEPQVLMGDFNLENDTDEIEEILKVFDDTYEEYNNDRDDTFPSYDLYGVSHESIDYIFARGYEEIEDSYVVDDMIENENTPSEYGSDHLPVVSILEF